MIGIKFPISDNSKRGSLFELTETKKDAVKSNIVFLLTTQKGERLYKPDFGTNLRSFIFEPLDNQTVVGIQEEIQSAITKYIQGVTINSINVQKNDITRSVEIDIAFSFSEGAFKYNDLISIAL